MRCEWTLDIIYSVTLLIPTLRLYNKTNISPLIMPMLMMGGSFALSDIVVIAVVVVQSFWKQL